MKIPGGLDTVAFGQLGADWIDNLTNVPNKKWAAITALTAATFGTLEVDTPLAVNGTVATNLNGKTLPAGMTIYGRFTRIQLTGGSVIAYRFVGD